MKIVKADNFDREGQVGDDVLIAENVSEQWAKVIVELLNDKTCHQYSEDFFKAVEDNYKLKKFEP